MSVSMAAPMYHNCVVCRCFFCPLLWGTRGQPPDSSLGTESDQNQFFSVLGRVSRVLDIALSENSVEVVPLALLDMRPVQWCLRLCPHRYHQSIVVVSQGLHQALCWWRDSSNLEQGQVVGVVTHHQLVFTGGSPVGVHSMRAVGSVAIGLASGHPGTYWSCKLSSWHSGSFCLDGIGIMSSSGQTARSRQPMSTGWGARNSCFGGTSYSRQAGLWSNFSPQVSGLMAWPLWGTSCLLPGSVVWMLQESPAPSTLVLYMRDHLSSLSLLGDTFQSNHQTMTGFTPAHLFYMQTVGWTSWTVLKTYPRVRTKRGNLGSLIQRTKVTK